MNGVLAGTLVIDWSLYLAGPVATALLGDLGADVIKLEQKGIGDPMRGLQTDMGLPAMLPGGKQAHFERHNRNKKGLAVDLETPDGRQIVLDLARKADVFLTNFRPAYAVQLGLDYESLTRQNDQLIYVSLTGNGPEGPDKDAPSLELIGQAIGGLMMTSGEDGGPPVSVSYGMADEITAICASYGILAGLLARNKQGQGQLIHVSQLGSVAAALSWQLWFAGLGRPLPRRRRDKTPNPMFNWYLCKDGSWIVLGGLYEKHWPLLCDILGLHDMVSDARFRSLQDRAANAVELIRMLDQVFAARTFDEWKAMFDRSKKISYGRVKTPEELVEDPQMRANRYVRSFHHPVLGELNMPGVGLNVGYSRTPASVAAPAPEVGQHTEELLVDLLGYSWDRIASLQDKGVI